MAGYGDRGNGGGSSELGFCGGGGGAGGDGGRGGFKRSQKSGRVWLPACPPARPVACTAHRLPACFVPVVLVPFTLPERTNGPYARRTLVATGVRWGTGRGRCQCAMARERAHSSVVLVGGVGSPAAATSATASVSIDRRPELRYGTAPHPVRCPGCHAHVIGVGPGAPFHARRIGLAGGRAAQGHGPRCRDAHRAHYWRPAGRCGGARPGHQPAAGA